MLNLLAHIESTPIKVCFSVIFLLLLIMFVGVFFLGIVNLGNIVGVIFSTVGFGMFAFNNKYSQLIDALNSKPIGRGVVNVVSWVLVAYILLATFITGCMVFKINNHPTEPSNIIVLGCKVKGTRPSLMLKRRLDTAYDYLIANPNVLAIVSGGKGSDEQISEAQCMRDYLVSKGIPESRIVMEDSSTSTYENFKYSKDILEERGLPTDSITVVTDGYHQLRASMIAKQLDFKTYSISAKTSWYLVPTYFIREWFGVVYQTVTIINN